MTLTYGYSGSNDNGNVLSQAIARGAQTWTQTYGYTDGLNRLTSANESGPGVAWGNGVGYSMDKSAILHGRGPEKPGGSRADYQNGHGSYCTGCNYRDTLSSSPPRELY